MKKILIASILAAGFIGSAMAFDFAGASGSAGAQSASGAIATSSSNGLSISSASNTTKASAQVGANSTSGSFGGWCNTPTVQYGSASVSGDVTTSSVSKASNVSFGNANGGAVAAGNANASASGLGTYDAGTRRSPVQGVAAGTATSKTANAVVAGRNEGGFVASGNASGFDASASSGKITSNRGTSLAETAHTSADAYSVSGAIGFGDAYILNTNGGSAAAGAASQAGGTVSAH